MDTQQKFSSITIALHWVIALSIIAMLGVGFYMSINEYYPLYDWHKSFGADFFSGACTDLVASEKRLAGAGACLSSVGASVGAGYSLGIDCRYGVDANLGHDVFRSGGLGHQGIWLGDGGGKQESGNRSDRTYPCRLGRAG